MARQEQVKEGINDLIGGDKKPKKTTHKDPRPVGVALSIKHIDKLDEIAAAIDTSRSEVIRYAINDLIERYESGEIRPVTETRTETVKVLKKDKQ